MVNHCAIHGCISKSGNTRHQGHVSTFALPRDPELRELWIQNLPEYVFKRKTARICHFHFRQEDVIKIDRVIVDNEFREFPRKNYKLKPHAIPVFFGSHAALEPSLICTSKDLSKKYGKKIVGAVRKDSSSDGFEDCDGSTFNKKKDASQVAHDIPFTKIQDISERVEDIPNSNVDNPAIFSYDNEEIEHLNHIADFYQQCEDLQKNWVFLQERNKAFLCHISLDTDVAMMDGSVCFKDDLRVVLGIGQEKIQEDYIPRYFKKINTTDKLQDLMDFVMRIISKAKKLKTDRTQNKENSPRNNIMSTKEFINDSIIEMPNKPNHPENMVKDNEVITQSKIHNNNNKSIIVNYTQSAPKSYSAEVIDRNHSNQEKNLFNNLNETDDEFNKCQEGDYIKDNKEVTFGEDDEINPNKEKEVEENNERINQNEEEVEENNEEVAYETDLINNQSEGESVCYEYISEYLDDNKDTPIEDKTDNLKGEHNHEEHLDKLDGNEDDCYFDKADYIEIKMETDSEGETCEDEQQIDDLMGVMKEVNEWKLKQSKDNNYFYTAEEGKIVHERAIQLESDLRNESEMQEDFQVQEESEVQGESEIQEELEMQCHSEIPHGAELDTELELPYDDAIQNDSELDEENSKDTFYCAQCNIVYGDQQVFVEHLPQCQDGSVETMVFVCELCNKEFQSDFELGDHFTISHNVEKSYETQTDHIRQHAAADTNLSQPAETDLSQSQEIDFIQRQEIIDLQHREVYRDCALCDKQFTSRSGYLNHLKSKHPAFGGGRGSTTASAKLYSCTLCSKSYRSAIELDGHLNGHRGEKPYTCEVCHRSYQSKNSLYTHAKTHTGESKMYQCDHCEQVFTQKVNCIAHMRLHTGEKPFTCEECGKSFTFVGLWKTHQRIHQGIMPYGCPVCHKKYHDKSSLKKHQLRQGHKGEAIIDENHIKISMYRKKRLQRKSKQEEIEC